jgi:iron(III) transport system substrate-binding protein
MVRVRHVAGISAGAVAVAALALVGTGAASPATPKAESQANTIVVYTGRREALIAPALKAYEAETGQRLRVKSGSNGALAQQILAEKGNPQASIFISQDAPTCELLRYGGALEPNPDRRLNVIPTAFRAKDNSWIGVSGRARVVMYNKNLVKKKDLPKTLQDLTSAKWRGKIAAPSTREASMVSWAGALAKVQGRAKAERLLTGIARNTTTLNSHTDVRQAVGRGEFPLGLVNHYYYHLQSAEGSPVGIVYTDQRGTQKKGTKPLGTLFNTASVCLVKGGPAQAEAKNLMLWMTSGRAQQLFAELNYEYPMRTGMSVTNGVKPLRQVTTMQVNLRQINPTVGLDLLNKAGFR